MATARYLLSLPSVASMPAQTLRDGVSAIAINAESANDAKAFANAQYNDDVPAMWDAATATSVAASSDMAGWKFRLKIVGAFASGASATPVFDQTVIADGTLETEVAAIAASKTLVSSAIYANNETVVLNGKTYTFKDTIGVTEGNVLVGISETASMANLVSAITHVGGTAGVNYVTAAVHPTMTAVSDGVHTITLTALTAGTAGNALTLAETSGTAAFAGGATTLSGGAAAITSTDKVSSLAEMMVAALNADASIAGAAFNNSTHVLTVAAGGDTLGDHRIVAAFMHPSADTNQMVSVPGFTPSQVDGGSAGDALTLTLVADSYTVPTVLALLGDNV